MKILSIVDERPAEFLSRLSFGEYALVRWIVFWRDEFRCVYYGASSCTTGVSLNLDHVIPRCHDGPNSWENLVTACAACNKGKAGNLLPISMRQRIQETVEKGNCRLLAELTSANPELSHKLDISSFIRRKTVVVEWKGESYQIGEWCDEPGGFIALKHNPSGKTVTISDTLGPRRLIHPDGSPREGTPDEFSTLVRFLYEHDIESAHIYGRGELYLEYRREMSQVRGTFRKEN